MNLDGYALPIKKLKGTEPVESLDLSGKKLRVASAIVIASLISVNGSLTKLSLAQNELEEEGTKAICEALEQNKTLKELDISGGGYRGNIGGLAGAKHVAKMLGVNGSLTVTNLLGNWLDAESAKMLAEVAKRKGISLCGIQRDQTTADFSNQNLEPRDAILLALDLSQAGVTGSLTVTNLLGNRLDAESAKMLAEGAKQKGISLCGIRRDQTTADFSNQKLKPPDAILLASDLLQAGVTGSLTKLSLAKNELGEEGTKAICEALEQSTTLKELDISGGWRASNIGGPAGVKHVAKMLGVNGSLTSIDLSSNQLCGLNWDGKGKYTTVGITAIADALRVNGALTKMRYVSPRANLGPHI